MDFSSSVTDFFKSPKWGMNVLLGGVCMIIPVIGPMILQGWHITGFWARRDQANPSEFPPFDFQFFGKYLERGLWPFLVALIAALARTAFTLILFTGPMIFMSEFGMDETSPRQGFPFILIPCLLIYLISLPLFSFITTPLLLCASITQDFGQSFNLSFIKNFIALVWREQVLSMLFMLGVYFVLIVITVVSCYVGGIFSFPIVIFAAAHLQKQLYQLYLTRGGEAIPVSPKLADVPPPLPP